MSLLKETLPELNAGKDFSAGEAASVFEELILSTDVPVIASLLSAWAEKGATAVELATCAGILRRKVFRVESIHADLVDIVGTGGSSSKLFNVSTAAAFVAAGAGVRVAKHGNRAASSKTGSADVLTELGVNIVADPSRGAEILDEIGICFLFAPKFHDLKPELAAARKSLGKPTIFNLLGPLANPAGAKFQLTGVWDKDCIEPMAQAAASLGTSKTWIVHAKSGLDEISQEGMTYVAEIEGTEINHFEIEPAEFGIEERKLTRHVEITPQTSAEIVKSVLSGNDLESPESSIVILNAAAAVFIAGGAKNLPEAVILARMSIESGAALQKLAELAEKTNYESA